VVSFRESANLPPPVGGRKRNEGHGNGRVVVADPGVAEFAPVIQEGFSLMWLHPAGRDLHVRAVLRAELKPDRVLTAVVDRRVVFAVLETDRQPAARTPGDHREVHGVGAALSRVRWLAVLSGDVIRNQRASR